MLARIPVTHQLLRASVQVLLAYPDTLPECRRRRLIENSHSTARSGRHLQTVETRACVWRPDSLGPHLIGRKRIALDGLIAMQFRRRNELLHALRPHRVAEVRIAKLTLEN